MTKHQPGLIDILYEALSKEVGLVVETSNAKALHTKLYSLRAQDPAFDVLSVTFSPINPDGEVWIYKKLGKISGEEI